MAAAVGRRKYARGGLPASAGIFDRLVVVVMRHVMMRVVRQMMMVVMGGMMTMGGSGCRTGDQRRHTDNDGQSRENLTH